MQIQTQPLLNRAQQIQMHDPIPYSEQIFMNLHLKKYKMLSHHNLHKILEKPNRPRHINSNGIVSSYSLTLIFLLICFSVANLFQCNRSYWPHTRSLINYFTIEILQQDDLAIYDMGDNVDEPSVEIFLYEDIQQHFERVVGFIGNYSQAGFVQFVKSEGDERDEAQWGNSSLSIQMERYYRNATFHKDTLSFEEFSGFLKRQDLRKFLLSLRVLYLQISFGNTKLVDDFRLIMDYEIHSHSMLSVDLSMQFEQKPMMQHSQEEQLKFSFVFRLLEQLCSSILLVINFLTMHKLYHNKKIDATFRRNSLYWCASLIFLNFITLTSSRFAPLCSLLQLLPIFENHDSSSTLTYNFNVNLRYAIPLVISALIPVYIVVNAFIMYSMIMYPGEYFDDYLTAFFSYFYNNFQYGIYEIFTELKTRGNLAYILYVILYFYMVLVGGNLVPALFCILIFRKIAERELMRYIEMKLRQVACPLCLTENYQKDSYGIQVNIASPKSPYLVSGTTLKSPQQKSKTKITKMFIEEEKEQVFVSSPVLSLKNKHKKIRDLSKDLQHRLEEGRKVGQKGDKDEYKAWLMRRLERISLIKSKMCNKK